jgi:hypothetical protein
MEVVQFGPGDRVEAFGCIGWVKEVEGGVVVCDFVVDGHTERGYFSLNGKTYPWAKEASLKKST